MKNSNKIVQWINQKNYEDPKFRKSAMSLAQSCEAVKKMLGSGKSKVEK